jgi:hypothetical protein
MIRLPRCVIQTLVAVLMLIIFPACDVEPLPTHRGASQPPLPYNPAPAPDYTPPSIFRPPATPPTSTQAADVSVRTHSHAGKPAQPATTRAAPRRETRKRSVVRRPSPSVTRSYRSYGAPRCRTGKPCGNSCISVSKTCRK